MGVSRKPLSIPSGPQFTKIMEEKSPLLFCSEKTAGKKGTLFKGLGSAVRIKS